MVELERFWSPDPVIAIKQQRKYGEFYTPHSLGRGVFAAGAWYEAKHGDETVLRFPDCRCFELEDSMRRWFGFNCGFYGWKSMESINLMVRPEHHCFDEPHALHDIQILGFFNIRGCDLGQYLLRQGNSVWLHVELGGTVIEHENGYRATKQRILREFTDEEYEKLRTVLLTSFEAACSRPTYYDWDSTFWNHKGGDVYVSYFFDDRFKHRLAWTEKEGVEEWLISENLKEL